ncbi:hypothetical protein L207DRAFT_570252 [Hyaloscypha variabilis F]|uniref:Cora-domain-containing protein n=1 Tax=Hyaloscypha variabilis (strain UAMH 11265 / GT02V1 / F) TaxID=1149755 RepID=A0A2J6R7Q7_HYAVF|nr:hypothetical protein L207DRAFT_570252 [Hyaloscypha variabilis F]
MTDPQPILEASIDSQELPRLTINPQRESGNQASRPENPSGATKMSTSDSLAKEAGASSRPTIPPESTESGPTNGESSISKVEDTKVKEVSYLDGTMFWVDLKPPAEHSGSPTISPFLWAPEDHRLCLGYLESWKQHDIPRFRGRERYTRRVESLGGDGLKNPLRELHDFIEAATNKDHGGHGIFIIRDTDLKGHNRLYDAQDWRVMEYYDRDFKVIYDDDDDLYLVNSTQLKVPSVKWDISRGEDDPYPLSPSPAPWRRICLLQGLNAIKPQIRRGNVMLPFIADEENTILQHLKGRQFFNPLSVVRRKRNPVYPSLVKRCSMVLQFSWYRKVDPPLEEIMDAKAGMDAEKLVAMDETIQWHIGSLYGQQHVQKTVYTVEAIQNPKENKNEVSCDGDYWTVLVLAPEGFYDVNSLIRKSIIPNTIVYRPLYRLPTVMLQRAAEALEFMIKDWSEILTYVEELLGDQELILSPEQHDKLLDDDKSGSRSRMYFWVINSLITFRVMMDESSQVYLEFRNAVIEDPQPDYSKEEQKIMIEATKTMENFERLGTRADVIRGRATVLLNSLFSAISVAESHRATDFTETIKLLTESTLEESRKSTRLGQNVMLLTYVSIFYLPLAFCTSLWATTSTFGFHNLIGVMAATGVATYIIAFNLRRISELYQVGRRKLVNSMTKDSNWKELGKKLEQSWSDDNNLGPSEWWIFIYFARSLFILNWSDLGDKKEDVGITVETVPDGHETQDSTRSDNNRKSDESRADLNENVPKQTPLRELREIDKYADGCKIEGETRKESSTKTTKPPKKSWFHLRRSRVPFSSHSKDQEPDIECQKSNPDSETDTRKGKGKDTAITREIE